MSGQKQPSTAAPSHGKQFTWHWRWLVGVVSVLLLIVMFVLVASGRRRRHTGSEPLSTRMTTRKSLAGCRVGVASQLAATHRGSQ